MKNDVYPCTPVLLYKSGVLKGVTFTRVWYPDDELLFCRSSPEGNFRVTTLLARNNYT